MFARLLTFALDGLDPRPVWVEVDLRPGLPAFTVVGLGDAAVRESRERVRAAIQNSGLEFPLRRITASLAPAHLRKAGPGFDAALALAVLAASGQVPADALEGLAAFGELSLLGELRGCRGTLAVAEGARAADVRALVVPAERGAEAALVDRLRVAPFGDLREVVAALRDGGLPASPAPPPAERPSAACVPDLADVRGHPVPIRALEVAAAGGHNLLLEGPPGTGKTMLARRLPGLLPPLSREEALEVTRIHSVAGLHAGDGLVRARPFRAPHHTISAPGLVGGATPPTPGEATLAHRGVLFLDELSEFSRASLEALRQPLEDGRVAIVRGQRAACFPTRFALVAATNPCPCGLAGTDRCRCGEAEIARHQRRLGGPLLDRIDIRVGVHRPTAEALAGAPTRTSEEVRGRVAAARERQRARRAATGALTNAELDAESARRRVALDPRAAELLRTAYERGSLSARGRHRALRLALTVADLAGRDRVGADEVLEALQLRERAPLEVAA